MWFASSQRTQPSERTDRDRCSTPARPWDDGGQEGTMSDETAGRIRQRLGEITDELRGLSSTDFVGKHQLNVEADALKRELSQLSELGDDSEIRRRWAERAARKSSHTADDDVEAAKAAIVSPNESGGST